MAGQSLIYANARVKVMENTLLSNEKITRMVLADRLEDGVKILIESGYGGAVGLTDPYAFETLLCSEAERLDAFVQESLPKNSGMETFLVKNDYHNAKVYAKAKYARLEDVSSMLMPAGLLDTERLHDAILDDNYVDLPKHMAQALEAVDRAMTESPSPRSVDILLDRAMFADIMDRMRAVKNPKLTEYWRANIDLANVSAWVRCKAIGKDRAFWRECAVEGGVLPVATLADIYDQSVDVLADKLRYSCYRPLADSIAASDMVAFETAWDNYLLRLFRDGKNDLFTLTPLAGYYVAKKIEIKNIRMILILLKNNADKSKIKQRLRELYE